MTARFIMGKRSVLQDETGSALLESTLSLTILMLMIFAILDLSRVLFVDHYVCYSAREATRYAMVHGSTWKNAACTNTASASCTATSTDIANYVKSITPMPTAGNSDLSVNASWNGKTVTGSGCNQSQGANSPGCVVTVQVSYNFNFVLPVLPKGTLVLSSTSAVPIAQ